MVHFLHLKIIPLTFDHYVVIATAKYYFVNNESIHSYSKQTGETYLKANHAFCILCQIIRIFQKSCTSQSENIQIPIFLPLDFKFTLGSRRIFLCKNHR